MNTSFNTEEIEKMAKRKSTAGETADVKLARMVSVKVPRLLKGIEQLGNLSRLKPNAKQRDYVFDQLKAQLEKAFAKWSAGPAVEKSSFQFPT